MKKIFALVCVGLTLSFVAFADNDIITQNKKDLPQTAQKTIEKEFGDKQIAFIKIDKDFFSNSYEVQFTNGYEISFDTKGVWTEVETERDAVPAAFIPQAIQQQVNQMFAGKHIVRIDKEKHGYDIQLSDGTELEFNKKFKLRDIDMD